MRGCPSATTIAALSTKRCSRGSCRIIIRIATFTVQRYPRSPAWIRRVTSSTVSSSVMGAKRPLRISMAFAWASASDSVSAHLTHFQSFQSWQSSMASRKNLVAQLGNVIRE